MQNDQERRKRVPITVKSEQSLPTQAEVEVNGRSHKETADENQTPAKSEQDWQERYLRLAADLENTKKRLTQSYARQAEQEKERLLLDFLEVADNLERALAYAKSDPDILAEGTKTIQRQFQQTLVKYRVRPFYAEGQPFDPERHEAVSVHYQPGLPANTVAHTVQTGYAIGDRVLRPARVVVTSDQQQASE